jgi:sec-independent protein translocase protein TatC
MTTSTPREEFDGHELRMSLWEHLNELRSRLVKAFLALIVGVVLALAVTEPAFNYLIAPFREIVGQDRINVLEPTGALIAYLRVSLLLGAILSIPVITYQVLMFILPGLTTKEKGVLLASLPVITALFLVGVAFSWFGLVPPALDFLANFQRDLFEIEWTADAYTGFVTALLFWMGVAFQTPLIFFVLSLLGLVEAGPLIRQWRIAIVAAAAAAAVITPTVDPVNMFLVMAPLLVLYVISIILVFFGSRRFRGS